MNFVLIYFSGQCRVAGWGRTSKYSENMIEKLQTALVLVTQQYPCHTVWPTLNQFQICTRPPVICEVRVYAVIHVSY